MNDHMSSPPHAVEDQPARRAGQRRRAGAQADAFAGEDRRRGERRQRVPGFVGLVRDLVAFELEYAEAARG
jgi:hypothetical protein